MGKKDFLMARIDLLKIIINTLLVAALGLAVYNLQVGGSPAANIGIVIVMAVFIVIFIFYIKLLFELEKVPSETVSVKLDVNLNDGIILTKDEKFKIIFEKDDNGNLVIRKGNL